LQIFKEISILTDLFVPLAGLVLHSKNLCFTERKATVIVIIYVQFITLSLTFHLDLDFPKFLFLSKFPTEILCVFLISTVYFSCSICPTVSQFTPHQHSFSSTHHTAPHNAILFFPWYFFCLPTKISLSHGPSTVFQVFSSVEHKHKHTPSNTLNSI
jgi:hypothetical protein